LTRRCRQWRETRRLVGLSPSPCPHPRIFIESRHPNEHRLLFASSFKRPPGAGTPPRHRYWHGQTLCVSCPALQIQLGQLLDKQFLRGFSEQGVVIRRIATRLASRHSRRSVTFVSGRATSIPALCGTSSHLNLSDFADFWFVRVRFTNAHRGKPRISGRVPKHLRLFLIEPRQGANLAHGITTCLGWVSAFSSRIRGYRSCSSGCSYSAP
jgi:hypothetical protein